MPLSTPVIVADVSIVNFFLSLMSVIIMAVVAAAIVAIFAAVATVNMGHCHAIG